MRVLFGMGSPGYLRYFDNTIRALLERGHTVTIAFNRRDMKAEQLDALSGAGERLEVVEGEVPTRTDLYDAPATTLRGVVDYARYLDPRFAHAEYLRERRRVALEFVPAFRFLAPLRTADPRRVKLLIATLLGLHEAIPSSPEVEAFILDQDPDVVLVSPLVTQASEQTEMVRSARALGIPVGLCVASWDNLTTKGLVRIQPHRVVVWNEVQKREAVEMHGVDPERIVITGAQTFDRWFDRGPTLDRESWCAKVGLPPEKDHVLFVGSTRGISQSDVEERFVERWVTALRESADPAVRDLAVFVRPHPDRPGRWESVDFPALGDAARWPLEPVNPVSAENRADFFDSLYHSRAIVGINTSAMLEAAIVGRPVLSIRAPEFQVTQTGTIHYTYMLPENGGFLREAGDLSEHVDQLSHVLSHPEEGAAELRRFVSSFVRPNGIDKPADPFLVAAIESLGTGPRPAPWRLPPHLWPARLIMRAVSLRGVWSSGGAAEMALEDGARRLAVRLRALAGVLDGRSAFLAAKVRYLARRAEKRAGRRRKRLRDVARERRGSEKARAKVLKQRMRA